MNALNELLDTARKMCERDSDSALSERLSVSRQTVMQWRKGERRITDEHLAKLISLAQADPALAVQVREEGAETKAEKALWGPLWDRLSPVTSTVAGALLMLVLLAPTPAQAAQAIQAEPQSAMYIMRIRLRRLAAWIATMGRRLGGCHASPVLA